MKRIFVLFITVISCAALFSQAQSTNVLTGNAEQNVLFAGIKNPVIVQVPGMRDGDIQLRSNDACVEKENGTWYITPKKNTKEWINVEVLYPNNGKLVQAGSKQFYVQNDRPKQVACIVTPVRTYRSDDRIPLTELLDDSTRVQVLFDEWVDYPEYDMVLSRFTVRCRTTNIRCAGETFSAVLKDSIQAAFNRGAEELPIHITPTLEKKSEHSHSTKILKNSTFIIGKP